MNSRAMPIIAIPAVGPVKELLLQQDAERREKMKNRPENQPDDHKDETTDYCPENVQHENTTMETTSSSESTTVADPLHASGGQHETKAITEKPKNMPQRLWEKYQALHQRREDICKKSEAKRIKDIQKKCVKTVVDEFSGNVSDMEVLQKHLPNTVRRKRSHADERLSNESSSNTKQAHWLNIKQYLHVNDHLTGGDKSRAKPKSKTEETLENALQSGDVETAEKLSDHLATREFGTKIADAIKARDFMEKKKVEDSKQIAKRKKTLNWGFAHKQRWETKGNM